MSHLLHVDPDQLFFRLVCDQSLIGSCALRRLKGSDTIPQQDSNGNLAVKLLRTFAAQTEALQRYRGKGQQKVTVEHVHVHTGGQAIPIRRGEGQ